MPPAFPASPPNAQQSHNKLLAALLIGRLRPIPPLRFAPIQFPSPRTSLEFPESSIPGIAGAVCGAVQSYTAYHGAVSKCSLASLVSFDPSIFRFEISLCLFQYEKVVSQFLDLFVFA